MWTIRNEIEKNEFEINNAVLSYDIKERNISYRNDINEISLVELDSIGKKKVEFTIKCLDQLIEIVLI